MIWLLSWMPLEGGEVSTVKGVDTYVVEVRGGAYETVKYGAKEVSFKVKASEPFSVEIKYWYDGEFWLKRYSYDAGEHDLRFSLQNKEGAEHIPVRSLGPRPTVITVIGKVLLSEVRTL